MEKRVSGASTKADEQTAEFSLIDSLSEIAPMRGRRWPATAHAQPRFLHALHDSGCASEATGWAPRYLIMRRAGQLVGAMPLYLKSHSRGEYVFDHGWAQAFERNGLPYYPAAGRDSVHARHGSAPAGA
jgi:predicted N-acyltransferase